MRSLTMMLAIIVILSFQSYFAQNPNHSSKYIEAALLNCPIKDFRLNEFIGGTLSKNDILGESCTIFFLRGHAEPDRWCQLCHYQCMDLAKLLKETKYESHKHEQFVFILPLSKDSLNIWFEAFSEQIATIRSWIKPSEANVKAQPESWNSIAQLLFQKKYLKADDSIQEFHFHSDPNANFAATMGIKSLHWSGQKMLQSNSIGSAST